MHKNIDPHDLKSQKHSFEPQSLIIALVFLAGLLFIGWEMKITLFPEPMNQMALVKKPLKQRAVLSAPTQSGVYTMFELPLELAHAEIHDIAVDGAVKWLGTDKGLVKIDGQNVTQYQQFSDWPFEWVRNMTISPAGIFVEILVAQGNTGGKYAGNHLFDPKTETWTEIGKNSHAQIWLNGALYQAHGALTRYRPENNWQAEEILPHICKKAVTSMAMTAVGNQLWIVGNGREMGCGVVRYDVKTQEKTVFGLIDGIIHEAGWDIAGDEKGVFVTHSVKYNRMSYFNQVKNHWEIFPRRGSGNVMMLSPDSIWLAAASPRNPLNRIDRVDASGTLYPPFSASENAYVSAIGQEAGKIWVGTYIKHWRDGKYTITSKLGYLPAP